MNLTQAQAQLLIEAWDVDMTMDDEEEARLLKENNPDLFEAYQVLRAIALGD